MRKYLAYYENEWPANIAELTAVENKPFVGYLKSGKEVRYTVIPEVQPNNEIWYTSSDGNIVTPYDLEHGTFAWNMISNTYENGRGIIKFDDSIPYIGQHAFNNCDSLTSITLPNSVINIEGGAFQDCSSLKYIIIPDGVRCIAALTFNYCTSLVSITIPNSVTSIEEYAFNSCISLPTITIPDSVTVIGQAAFDGCSSLNTITFKSTIEKWNSITKEPYWNSGVPATVVHCTDGDVTL